MITPPRARLLSAERFRSLLAAAPPVDADFADDVRTLREQLPAPDDPWAS